MSGLDVGLLLFAALGVLVGMKIGVVSAFFNVVAGFVGSMVASRFYTTVMAWVPWRPSVSYLIVFIIAAGGFVALGIFLSGVLEKFPFGFADKIIGAFLGVLLSLVLAVSVLLPLVLDQRPAVRRLVRRSILAPPLMRISQNYLHLAPRHLWDDVKVWLEPEKLFRP